jgi:hypothetical protein
MRALTEAIQIQIELPLRREKRLIGLATSHELEPLDERCGDTLPGGAHVTRLVFMTAIWSGIKVGGVSGREAAPSSPRGRHGR